MRDKIDGEFTKLCNSKWAATIAKELKKENPSDQDLEDELYQCVLVRLVILASGSEDQTIRQKCTKALSVLRGTS